MKQKKLRGPVKRKKSAGESKPFQRWKLPKITTFSRGIAITHACLCRAKTMQSRLVYGVLSREVKKTSASRDQGMAQNQSA